MKIIFLDIDGVLNTHESMYRRYFNRDVCLEEEIGLERPMYHELSYYSTRLLSDIIKEVDANIVISSTWRYHWEPQEMEKIMKYFGFEHDNKVIGSTDILSGQPRGIEIQKWLDDNKHLGIENFIIIDDDSDMEHLSDKLVKTENETGFLMTHRIKATNMLRNNTGGDKNE